MLRKVAKELIHIRDWFSRVGEIVEHGQESYLGKPPSGAS